MRKIINFVLCIFLVGIQVYPINAQVISESLIVKDFEISLQALEKLDLIHNAKERWKQGDNITRRDAFSLVYVIKMNTKEYIKDEPDELREFMQHLKEKYGIAFSDIKTNSDDEYLLASLIYARLIDGRSESNRYFYAEYADSHFIGSLDNIYQYYGGWHEGVYPKADFDSFTTYEEALTMIGRLFNDLKIMRHYEEFPYGEEHEYYEYAKKIGLINSELKMDASSPYITVEQLGKSMPAWEFLHLLYRAMYIPFEYEGEWTYNGNCHYIDRFIGVDPKGVYTVNNKEKCIAL